MKKLIALVLVFLISLAISAPLFAMADVATDPPAPNTPVVALDLDAPVVESATSEAQEAEPGGIVIDITALLTWLIQALVIPILIHSARWVKARVGERNFDLLMQAVTLAVNAAEEKYRTGHGEEKYKYVVDYLKRRKLGFDEAEIKAVVYDEFNRFKQEVSQGGES